MMRLKRTLFYILSVIFCFLLQTSVFQFLKLADVMPNVLLILTVTLGLIMGKESRDRHRIFLRSADRYIFR